MSKVKVLFFAADPLSAHGRAPRLLLDEDVRQIRRKVRAAEHRDALDFDFRLAAQADDLIQALSETLPRVVHFSGHGDRDGLVLASADGLRAHAADAAALRQLFEAFHGDIRVVVLNACLSLPQAEAIADVVGCAIGTRGSISDEAAITFGASFYRAIAFGHSVRAAYDQARVALALEHFEDRECPELVVRPDVDPARLVLVPPGAAPGPRWPRMVAVAAALVAATILLNECRGDGELQRTLGIAGRRSAADSTACGAAPPSPAGPATTSTAPGDPAPAEADLAAAKDLYEAENFTAACPLFERAAEAGNVEAMGFLGIMHLNGQGTRRNESLADLWLRKAAEKRDPRAMHALGTAYEMDRRYHWAMVWYRNAAEEKAYAPAMSSIAKMYERGLGVEASRAEALAWYRKAVAAGSVEAMVDAGEIHQRGLAGARDANEALRLYRAAAARGSARGMVAIGRMYQEGDGVPRDYEAARSWYRKGVAAGSPDAMNNLGVLYRNGWGVRENRAEAIRWFRRAARAGSTVAAANLAGLEGN